MGHPDVWIVVAAFNEASVIGDVIADVRSVFDHVVCVDDGSGDGTGEIALRAGAHLVRHPVNVGQGVATLVIDCFSRVIVGWRASSVKDTALVTTALKMALWRRNHRPLCWKGLRHQWQH